MPGTSEHGAIALAVIGGTGLYRLAALGEVETLEGDTIYGAPSGPVRVGRIGGHAVAFLARHGEGHSLPPHKVNYRANLRRLADLGARRVLAVNAVGGITAAYGPRVVAVPDQLIDYTWGRVSTVCEEPGTEVVHVDFGDPYTPSLRAAVLRAAAAAGVAVVGGGCHGVTQGPRLPGAGGELGGRLRRRRRRSRRGGDHHGRGARQRRGCVRRIAGPAGTPARGLKRRALSSPGRLFIIGPRS